MENAINGVSGIGTITRLNRTNIRLKVAGELKDFKMEDYMDKRDARKMDRFTQYAVASAKMAVEDAGLENNEEQFRPVGVWVGSGIGGMETFRTQFETYLSRGHAEGEPFLCTHDDP